MKRKNLNGEKYGYLEVIKDGDKDHVLCRCLLCGKEKAVDRYNLMRGHTKSCGCYREQSGRVNADNLSKEKDITGKIFADVKVLEKTDQKKGTQYIYKCQCLRCGKVFYTRGEQK